MPHSFTLKLDPEKPIALSSIEYRASQALGLHRKEIEFTLSHDGTLCFTKMPPKKKDRGNGPDDSELPNFLKDVRTLGMNQLVLRWALCICTRFSVGALRDILTKGPFVAHECIGRCLFMGATTLQDVERAFRVYPYYRIAERQKLVLLITGSPEKGAGRTAAYMLSRAFMVWERTMYDLILARERQWLITMLIWRKDYENAELALMWAEQYRFKWHKKEEKALLEFVQSAHSQ